MALQPERWQKIKDLLTQVEALSTNQQDAFLQQQCADNPTLIPEVKRLMHTVDEKTTVISTGLRPKGYVDLANTLPGAVLGSWRLLRELGRGGMGSVWLAERADLEFTMPAAVKLISNPIANTKQQERFRKERQLLANLLHPNISALYDGGTTDAGQPYLVMEYIDGETIDVYCQKHRATLIQILELFQQITSAVCYAHRKGVLHRDIKPHNIMVSREGFPKLMDFGIAAHLNDPDRTRPGASPMTPAYASPEQLQGMPATMASDLYALGLVLLQLVTGKMPRGSHRDPLELWHTSQPKLKAVLSRLMQGLLQPKPALRFRTAEQIQGEIEACILGLKQSQLRSATKISEQDGDVSQASSFLSKAKASMMSKFKSLVRKKAPPRHPEVTMEDEIHNLEAKGNEVRIVLSQANTREAITQGEIDAVRAKIAPLQTKWKAEANPRLKQTLADYLSEYRQEEEQLIHRLTKERKHTQNLKKNYQQFQEVLNALRERRDQVASRLQVAEASRQVHEYASGLDGKGGREYLATLDNELLDMEAHTDAARELLPDWLERDLDHDS